MDGIARDNQSGWAMGVGRVLVLADDGRMAGLLRRRLTDCRFEVEASVLEGIRRVAGGDYGVVLVNAEDMQVKLNW